MKLCQHRLSWNPDWRCHKRGIFGRCVEHHLERFRWQSDESKRGLYWNVDLSNMNRPHLSIDDERPIEFVALSWGNGNSDPVWTIGWQKRREVSPLTRCEVCDETLNESISDHLAEHHLNEFFTIDYDPASGLGVISEMAQG